MKHSTFARTIPADQEKLMYRHDTMLDLTVVAVAIDVVVVVVVITFMAVVMMITDGVMSFAKNPWSVAWFVHCFHVEISLG